MIFTQNTHQNVKRIFSCCIVLFAQDSSEPLPLAVSVRRAVCVRGGTREKNTADATCVCVCVCTLKSLGLSSIQQSFCRMNRKNCAFDTAELFQFLCQNHSLFFNSKCWKKVNFKSRQMQFSIWYQSLYQKANFQRFEVQVNWTFVCGWGRNWAANTTLLSARFANGGRISQ